MKKSKRIEMAVLFGLVFSILFSFMGFNSKCDTLRNNILRLHIIANSDSKEDQELKLFVRDAVLKYTSSDFLNCDSLESAILVANANIDKICNIADGVIEKNGFSYKSSVEVKKEFFDIREYDDFTLPAGEYNSLVLRLGKAEGHNWWCVIFPGVCIPAADEEISLDKSVDNAAADIAYNSEKYYLRFKMFEIYEKLKYNFKKNKKI